MRTCRLALIASSLLTSAPAAAQTGRGWGGYGDGWMMWWMPFHGIIWLVLVAAFVVGLVLLIRWLWQSGERAAGTSPRRSAIEMLDERYARGEIEREDYLQRRRDLLDRT